MPNILISWSGERSLLVAKAIRKWLPKIIQTAKPWMSDTDIAKGSRGLDDLSKALEGIKVGISCLTPENLREPWILFEAGALSKSLDDRTRLCTFLVGGLQLQDVSPPLGMFQATRAEKEDTRKLMHTINQALSNEPISEEDLNDLFDKMWPTLEDTLKTLPEPTQTVAPKRPLEDMVAEILENARAEASRRKRSEHLDVFIPIFEELLPFFREMLRETRKAKQMETGRITIGELMRPAAEPIASPVMKLPGDAGKHQNSEGHDCPGRQFTVRSRGLGGSYTDNVECQACHQVLEAVGEHLLQKADKKML
jgi:hypothetical protein